MTAAPSDFVQAFPEFGQAAQYPPGQIAFWLAQAYQQLNSNRFGQQLDLAAMLFTAHNLSLSARAQAAANVGAPPGGVVAPVSSKSVGAVSINYDTDATNAEGAGSWNATQYGQRLYSMMRAFGGGPSYARGPRRPVDPFFFGRRF